MDSINDTNIVECLCSDDKSVHICLDTIEEGLRDAHGWNRFLGISKGFSPLVVNDKNQLTFCKEYDISSQVLLLLISFLKTGYFPFISNKRFTTDNNPIIMRITEVCNVLGGIPKFDEWLNKLILSDAEIRKKEEEVYNPQFPAADTEFRYSWAIVGFVASDNGIYPKDGYSVTSGKTNHAFHYYIRRLRK